ncbi:hypothetical protein F4776DRAFT_657687 [Hypoxylon sp. NC0597]|nr:hypothetical protein F4776DRAFT_657687 [Hypoxylon sp. NC0597]
MESSFHQFCLLPAEIRCKIWRFAIPCRIIPARLKLDLDTWNAATETDLLMTHYRVIYDGQRPLLPSAGLVNHEAHHEMIKRYKPLRLSRDAVKHALGYQKVDDTAFNTICDSSRISSFNPECDVLEWMAPQRWIVPDFEKRCPLFIAACLSVRHVSFHFQEKTPTRLDIIALAVLDPDQPLETLTITMRRTAERVFRSRLARRPSKPEALQGGFEDIHRILLQHAAYFPSWDEALFKRLTSAHIDGALYMPRPQASRLGTQFSIYEILYQDDFEDKKYLARRWTSLRWGFYTYCLPWILSARLRRTWIGSSVSELGA